jgi:hypothetical protein
MTLSYIPFNGTYERKSTMPIITKAEHMFSTGVFNSYCATLHFDYRVNPNVAEQINFDIKNIGDLPALRVVNFFNESNPNLLFIQDVTTDGVMPEIKSDLLFKLFDAKNGVLMGQFGCNLTPEHIFLPKHARTSPHVLVHSYLNIH